MGLNGDDAASQTIAKPISSFHQPTQSHPQLTMPTLLAGDIGGTKTILRLAEYTPSITLQNNDSPPSVLYEQTYVSQQFSDLVPMVTSFLAEASTELKGTLTPKIACFGIAGPVTDGRSELTNLKWSLDVKEIEKALGIETVSLINDFAANGYGVLGLADSDLHTLQAAPISSSAPIAVIGAGTGLGEAFLIPQAGCYQVFPGEGSHADFAPQEDVSYRLCRLFTNIFEMIATPRQNIPK